VPISVLVLHPQQLNADISNNTASLSLGEGSRALGYEIIAGYGKHIAQMYLAGELSYHGGDVDTGTFVNGASTLSAKNRNTKSASLIVGFSPSYNSLIYAKLGKGVIDAQMTATNSGVAVSDSTDIDVITKGIGFEYMISHKVSLNTEVNFIDGDKTISGIKYAVKGNSITAGIKSRF